MGAVGFMIVTGAILVDFFDHADEPDADEGTETEALTSTASSGVALDVEQHVKRWPLYESVKLVLCNHLGTAALGSFLITLVVIVRWTLTYLLEEAKAKDTTGVMQYVAACVECLMECVEQCLRYMVNTAYILTVLEGRWFFSAVCGGLYAMFMNASQILATNYIAFALLWLIKLAVPLGTTTLAYFMLDSGSFGVVKTDLSSTFNLLVPVFLISVIFSFTFMSLLGTAIDVVLIAFIKAEEMDEAHPDLNVIRKMPVDFRKRFTAYKADKAKSKQEEADAKKGPDEEQGGDKGEAEEDRCC